MKGALEGTIVVALEQAVAAPFATSKLADAGARVIKLERPEGDFARGYDDYVLGQSSYYVWNNRGKESCRVDLKKPEDLDLLRAMLAKADVFVQNLAPGATGRLGIGSAELRAAPSSPDRLRHRRLCPGNARPRTQGLRPSDPGRSGLGERDGFLRVRTEPRRHFHLRRRDWSGCFRRDP